MELNEYQERARVTRFDQTKGLDKGYSGLGLTGEAGEVADKIKKYIRGDDIEDLEAWKIEVAKELGDVLWYVVAVADDLGVDLETVAAANLDKLASRQQRGVLNGNGDNR